MLAGKTLARRYQLLELIGTGGMSDVYKATNLQMGNVVCVKILREHVFDSMNGLRRMQVEAKALAALDHPNILRIIAMDADDSICFLVTELVEGRSLEALLQDGPLAADRLKNIFRQIASALQYAHEQGIVHRDLKPSNLFIATVGGAEQVKILDFGIAKFIDANTVQRLTRTGALLGTPHYMAPEQCSAQKLDKRADIYSLGCVLYQCITGKLPFNGETVMDVMMKHLSETRPQAPGALGAVALQAMQVSPEDRFQSANDFLDALDNGVVARPRSAAKPLHFKAKSMIVPTLILCALMIVCLYLFQPHEPGNTQRRTQEGPMPEHGANTGYKLSEEYLLKGQKQQTLGNFDEANSCFKTALELAHETRRTNPWAVADYSYNLMKAGQAKESLALATAELQYAEINDARTGDRTILLTTLARRLQQNKNYGLAERRFKEAMDLWSSGSIEQAGAGHERAVNLAMAQQLDSALKVIDTWNRDYGAGADRLSIDEMEFARGECLIVYGHGKVAQGAEILERIISHKVTTPESARQHQRIQLPLGLADIALGHPEKSIKLLESVRTTALAMNDRQEADRVEEALELARAQIAQRAAQRSDH